MERGLVRCDAARARPRTSTITMSLQAVLAPLRGLDSYLYIVVVVVVVYLSIYLSSTGASDNPLPSRVDPARRPKVHNPHSEVKAREAPENARRRQPRRPFPAAAWSPPGHSVRACVDARPATRRAARRYRDGLGAPHALTDWRHTHPRTYRCQLCRRRRATSSSTMAPRAAPSSPARPMARSRPPRRSPRPTTRRRGRFSMPTTTSAAASSRAPPRRRSS